MNGALEGLYGGLEREEWRTDHDLEPYDDDLPVLYDPEHAAFMHAVTADYDLSTATLDNVIDDLESRSTDLTDSTDQDYVLKTISEFQDQREERPRIQTTSAYVADYLIVNEDRHEEILDILYGAVEGDTWIDEGSDMDNGYPAVDWDYVRDHADGSLSDRHIGVLESRYEEPVEQHLSLTLVPDGGLWSANGDYLTLRLDDSKPCAYSIESNIAAEDAVAIDTDGLDDIPDDYDIDNAVQLRIVRIPTSQERPTSLTPQLFEDLDQGMEVTVRGAYSDDLSMNDVELDRPMVLMGTGSGGVPINSIADAVLESDFKEPVFLYQTAKFQDHFLHKDRMELAGELRENFYPVHSATRERALNPEYDGPADYPQHALLKQVDPGVDADIDALSDLEQNYLEQDPEPTTPAIDPSEPVFMACGNSYFGADLERVLEALGVAEHDRHMEIFGG